MNHRLNRQTNGVKGIKKGIKIVKHKKDELIKVHLFLCAY